MVEEAQSTKVSVNRANACWIPDPAFDGSAIVKRRGLAGRHVRGYRQGVFRIAVPIEPCAKICCTSSLLVRILDDGVHSWFAQSGSCCRPWSTGPVSGA